MAERDMKAFTPHGMQVRVVSDLVFVYAKERLVGYGLAHLATTRVEWLRQPSKCERERGAAETTALGLSLQRHRAVGFREMRLRA